ncbi:MAG TPA: 3-hydroxyacyl-CoA dehydrogenase NAD-binding domain-containing protein [Candidatus Limnocylindria bacterium]|nr:3-hydroxyacyl-CoA dehydrogenase NAD-binding domain-containing protein [Candidatus Limnocylindria bacterium]
MDVKTIGVIGAGAKGCEIACASLMAGFRTVLEDVSPEILERGVANIRQTLEECVTAGKITPQQKDAAHANLSTANKVEDVCRQADLLIEALPEEMEMQLEIFTIFDKFARTDAILASTASSLSINELAAITFRMENCVGLRFSCPTPDVKLLEIIRATETSDATVAACAEVGRRMGKKAVVLRESRESVHGRTRATQA